jgi:phosphoribosylformylglycinamidine synthase
MGAAGLTSSSCEMGSRGGVGIEIDLDRVPQRESGMTAYEMLLSESQERMLLVAEKGREEEVFRVFRKWGLDAVTIGEVTGDGLLRVRHHGAIEAEIPNHALAEEAPRYDRPHTIPYRTAPMEPRPYTVPDAQTALLALLASPDLCSKRAIWEQYDYTVRTNTTAGPGGDAAIVRIKETGNSIAISLDGSGRYCYLSPRQGAKLNVAECCRNLATVGALPVAATNNLNFGNPERPEVMAQLVEAIEGMAEACKFFDTPITGGNVSLYNETLGEGIYPTPVIGVVGLLKTAPPVTIDFKEPGRDILLLGGVRPTTETEFGSSEYAKIILGQLWGMPPALDMAYEKRVHEAMREIHSLGLSQSAHDLSEGGLAVTLAECCSRMGADVRLHSTLSPEHLLFGESPSRILLCSLDTESIVGIARKHEVECDKIGVTMKERLRIQNGPVTLIDCELATLQFDLPIAH